MVRVAEFTRKRSHFIKLGVFGALSAKLKKTGQTAVSINKEIVSPIPEAHSFQIGDDCD
jgi:hypothetical protein